MLVFVSFIIHVFLMSNVEARARIQEQTANYRCQLDYIRFCTLRLGRAGPARSLSSTISTLLVTGDCGLNAIHHINKNHRTSVAVNRCYDLQYTTCGRKRFFIIYRPKYVYMLITTKLNMRRQHGDSAVFLSLINDQLRDAAPV